MIAAGIAPAGEARSMTLVEVSDADFSMARDILTSEVPPDLANVRVATGLHAGTTALVKLSV